MNYLQKNYKMQKTTKALLQEIKGFFCIYWAYHMVFIFHFVKMVCHIGWFVYIEESCTPGIQNPTWSWKQQNSVKQLSFNLKKKNLKKKEIKNV